MAAASREGNPSHPSQLRCLFSNTRKVANWLIQICATRRYFVLYVVYYAHRQCLVTVHGAVQYAEDRLRRRRPKFHAHSSGAASSGIGAFADFRFSQVPKADTIHTTEIFSRSYMLVLVLVLLLVPPLFAAARDGGGDVVPPRRHRSTCRRELPS